MDNPFLSCIRHEWLETIRVQAIECEARRQFTRKPKTTGTISEAACLYLRAIVDAVQPATVVEVGTFIGTSALVLASTGAVVHTCDKDNDAFHSQGRIIAYGKTSSTDMLRTFVGRTDVTVNLWFFDGRIQDEDLPWIEDFSDERTVYAFDDFEYREKGVINATRLHRYVPNHSLIVPPTRVLDLPTRTTIAVLVPPGASWR